MVRSIGLSAYRALAGRGEARMPELVVDRPLGEVLWIHCAEPDAYLAVQDLAKRQIASRPDLSVLITLPPHVTQRRTRE